MSIRVEWNELLPWIGTFTAAAVVTMIWLVRSKREKMEFTEAEECLKNEQYIECLRHLSKAHENWQLNMANLTPKNILRDIDRLIALIQMIGVATTKLGSPVDIKQLLTALKEWRAIFSDKSHYKFASHTLKQEFAEREQTLERQFGELRSGRRGSYSQLLR